MELYMKNAAFKQKFDPEMMGLYMPKTAYALDAKMCVFHAFFFCKTHFQHINAFAYAFN